MSTSKATSLWKKTLWQSSNLPSYNFCHQNSICIPSNLESCTFQTNQPNLYLLVWVLFLVLHQTQDAWLYKSVANQQPEHHFKGAHHVDHHVDHHVAHHVDLHVVDHHMDHNVDHHVWVSPGYQLNEVLAVHGGWWYPWKIKHVGLTPEITTQEKAAFTEGIYYIIERLTLISYPSI